MTHSKVTLVILAAGMGSRYGSLKQIKGIGPCGEILLDYSVYDAIVTGFKKVIFVIQKETESFFYHRIKTMYPSHIEFHCVEQNTYNILEEFEINTKRKKPWGTGHALLTTASLIQEPCCVINADDF